MRLRSEIWVRAYLRRCAVSGVPAVVVRHGDDDAGAIYIRVNKLDGTSLVFGPAPAGWDGGDVDRQWVRLHGKAETEDRAADELIARQAEFDPDLWVVEIEDREGRHFLEEWLSDDA